MTCVRAFEIVHDDEVVECLERTTVRLPLGDVVADGIHSWQPRPAARRSGHRLHPHAHLFDPSHEVAPLRIGRFVMRSPGGERLREGVIRVREPADFAPWVSRTLVPAKGTALRAWLRTQGAEPEGPGWDRRSRKALRRLERLLSPFRGHGSTTVSDFPGLYGTGAEGCFELEPIEVPSGRPVLCRTSHEGVEVTIKRRLGSSGGQVPLVQRLRVSADDGWSYFDGHTFDVGDDLDALPERVRAMMDERGTAYAPSGVPMRPLSDLVPTFIVRPPSRRALESIGGPAACPPPCAGRPALLFPSTDPVPLLGPDGGLRDIPIVVDPADAAAILVRVTGQGVYVPHGHPLDWRDLLRRRGGWYVGAELSL